MDQAVVRPLTRTTSGKTPERACPARVSVWKAAAFAQTDSGFPCIIRPRRLWLRWNHLIFLHLFARNSRGKV